MAKKPKAPEVDGTGTEVVEEFHVVDEAVEYTDVTGKDDLPLDVQDVDEGEDKPAAKPAKAKPAAKSDDDEIPEDLKGKTPAQLAKMYRDAQSVIGRQGTELGDLRRTADSYIKAHLKATTPKPTAAAPEKEPDDVDFFTDPKASIAKIIGSHPALKKLEDSTKNFEQLEVLRRREHNADKFSKAHPDAGEIMADEGFRNWVTASPVRQAMLLRAHQHYDFDAGNEVFSTWKELKAARAPVVPEKQVAGKQVAARAAARVPTGGNAAPRDSGGGKEGKIYRRADLIRLHTEDPDRYEMMGDEITKAYSEGRVR